MMPSPTPTDVLLLGAGGHARAVADAARARGIRIIGVLDDDPDRTIEGVDAPNLGPASMPPANLLHYAVHAATGDAARRQAWLEPFSQALTIDHPSAEVSPEATIGAGVFIGPRAIINAGAEVQDGAIINSGAIIEHDVHVGRFAHVAPGAIVCGEAVLGAAAWVGAGAIILPRVRVGHHATVGAGAVVTTAVPDGTTVVGIPAK
jgi:sugar O-acyltransferase (sialic acid O-acetyltransferase NeuD family)